MCGRSSSTACSTRWHGRPGPVTGQTVPMTIRLGSHLGSQATLQEFFRLCDAGDLRIRPELGRPVRGARREADRQPGAVRLLDADPDHAPGALRLVEVGGVRAGPRGRRVGRGDGSALSPARLAAVKAMLQRPMYIAKRGLPANYELPRVVPRRRVCRQRQPDVLRRVSAAGPRRRARGYFGRIWSWVQHLRGLERADDDRYLGPFNPRHRQPGAGGREPLRPGDTVRGGGQGRSLLPNSRLLTVNGWGHTSLFLSACA